jgi:hypothetical protein
MNCTHQNCDDEGNCMACDINVFKERDAILKKDITDWQARADMTDFDDEGGSKYDEVSLKILVDEARTLLLRANLNL